MPIVSRTSTYSVVKIRLNKGLMIDQEGSAQFAVALIEKGVRK